MSARPSTPAATTRAARWSEPPGGSIAASPGTPTTPRRASSSSGSCRAGSTRTCGRSRRRGSPPRRSTAWLSAGRSAARRRRSARWAGGRSPALPASPPPTLLGMGEVADILGAVGGGVALFACATPPRLARHGTALVPEPATRWRLDLAKPAHQRDPGPIAAGCPCRACREHSRGYLHYLVRAGELTAKRLITLHNLTFMAALMRGVRSAIEAGQLPAYAGAVARGNAPYPADLPAAANGPGRRVGPERAQRECSRMN